MTLTPHQISLHIKRGKFREAEQAIIQFVLFNVDNKNELNFVSPDNPLQNTKTQHGRDLDSVCNEYTSVISELFCHPQYRPSDNIIHSFLSYKFVIDWLFSASIWKNTDAIIKHLKLVDVNKFGQLKIDTNKKKVILLLTLVCLGSKYKLPWKVLFKTSPAFAISAYIGLVTQSLPALSEENDKGFNHLLASAKDLPILDLPVLTDLGKLNYAYFNCSYATSPDKYEFKKWLTKLIRHNIKQWLDDDVKKYIADLHPPQSKKRPKVAVMLELYTRDHAMYRCFNSVLTNLSKKYELIAFIDESDVQDSDLSIFEKTVTFRSVFDINENAQSIVNEKPDIVFYTSIGMKFWGIYLSQLRLAPIQIMVPGHPSSSYSPEIDYCLLFGSSSTAQDIQPYFSEKVLVGDTLPKDVRFHSRHSALTDEFISKHNVFLEDDAEIVVGINGVTTKVTNTIINVCKRIQQKSSKKVTFIFFSSHTSKQLAFLAANKQLSRELKNFELVCFSDFISYMKTISKCHFLLPTLPFGGSNSNIDAMVLNKPKLFIEGTAEIYTRCDLWEWERVGLEKDLGCITEDSLIQNSLKIIEDTQYRKMLHERISGHCMLNNLFSNEKAAQDMISDVFIKAINDAVDLCN